MDSIPALKLCAQVFVTMSLSPRLQPPTFRTFSDDLQVPQTQSDQTELIVFPQNLTHVSCFSLLNHA